MSKQARRPRTGCRVDPADLALVQAFVEARFRPEIPSPIRAVLRVRRVGQHFGARVLLFDGGPCLLVVERYSGLFGESRWIYRGYPGADDRPFLFHRTMNGWLRFGGTFHQALGIFGADFV